MGERCIDTNGLVPAFGWAMPEGDTIFRSAQVLHAALSGRRVVRFETALAQLAAVPIAGRSVAHVTARGKHLLIVFDGDLVLRTHMRMSGSWHVYRPGERWRRPASAARIVLVTDQVVAVAFDVQDAEFAAGERLERKLSARLGPDLLASGFDEQEALRRLRANRERSVADALLDQRNLAGLGNVYKSEVLFLAGLHPDLPVGEIPDILLATLLAVARAALLSNVPSDHGRRVTADRRTTRRMAPSERLWVYGRGGRPCRRCGTAIEWRRHGVDARSTYWCPRCQPGPCLAEVPTDL